jgi:putative transposase
MRKKSPFKYYKSSPEIIRFAVKLYVQYGLSLRQCEDMLAERGIDVSYEAIRYWVRKLGPRLAAEIRKRRIKRGFGSKWRWHIDEVFVRVNGRIHYMWRVIDHEGEVLEVFVSKRRNKAAALKVLKKAMRRYGRPDEVVTDKCPSYGAALRELNTGIQHITDQYENNLSEVSHQPFRRRERTQQKFRGHDSLQRFASTHASVYNHFNTERHKISRARMKQLRSAANAEWTELLAA